MAIDRKRTFDSSKLSPEETEKLSRDISDKVSAILNETDSKINDLLKIYGMEAVLVAQFGGLGFREEALKEKK